MLEVRKLRPRQITCLVQGSSSFQGWKQNLGPLTPSGAFPSDHVTTLGLLQTAAQGSASLTVDVADLHVYGVLLWQMAVRVLL